MTPTESTAVDVRLGYSLVCDQHRSKDLVGLVQGAEEAGFRYASISDRFHPTIGDAGSPFVWSLLGALAHATKTLEVGTGVTCPTMRYHPAIIAQAAATVAWLMPGRFFLGVGTGEYRNERIVGRGWPAYRTRAAMLHEAVTLIRRLWRGETVDREGEYFTVENARLQTEIERPPRIVVAADGPKAAALAGRIGDGLMSTRPDPELVARFDSAASDRTDANPHVTVRDENAALARRHYLHLNVSWSDDEEGAIRQARSHWPQAGTAEIANTIACGPRPEKHLAKIHEAVDAGYDSIHVNQVGRDHEGFLRFYEREILPAFRSQRLIGVMHAAG